MPMSVTSARTPYFVLLDRKCRIGPIMAPKNEGADCVPIYGFSARQAYQKFCDNCDKSLVPYPLVKVYLGARSCDSGQGPKLVVLDAAGPQEACLQAATIDAVLEAHEQARAWVTAAYQLIFDQDALGYRLAAESL